MGNVFLKLGTTVSRMMVRSLAAPRLRPTRKQGHEFGPLQRRFCCCCEKTGRQESKIIIAQGVVDFRGMFWTSLKNSVAVLRRSACVAAPAVA